MHNPKEKFIQVIETIVNDEDMKEALQTEYELEGAELIDRLLNEAVVSDEEPDNAKKLFMGVSSEGLNGINVITELGGLLIACISLYLELKKGKSEKINRKMEKIEAQRKLLGYMKEQQMPAELISKINLQYSNSLVETLDELS